MATDDRADIVVSTALRRYLGSAVGPDGQWVNAPASRIIASLALEPRRAHRWPRPSLLLAAALTVLLAAAAILVSGGLTRPSVPPPVPPNAPLVAPTDTHTPTDATRSPAAVVTEPTPNDTPAPCRDTWSSTGTASAKGLQDGIRTVKFDGSEGYLVMIFGHPIDSVHQISVVPVEPPFVTSAGRTVKVAGGAFFRLTLSGLTRPTDIAPDDMVAGVPVGHFTPTVASPIMEMRRLRKPRLRRPVDGPSSDAAEVWIIGVDYPSCLRVTTTHTAGYSDDPDGDNMVVVRFDPRPTAPS